MAPDEQTNGPVTINRLFDSVNPIPQAAQPEYEFNIEMTTGMSAPPIGRIRRNPKASDSRTSRAKTELDSVVQNNTISRINNAPRAALSGGCIGKTSGAPETSPRNLPKPPPPPATVIAPILT